MTTLSEANLFRGGPDDLREGLVFWRAGHPGQLAQAGVLHRDGQCRVALPLHQAHLDGAARAQGRL